MTRIYVVEDDKSICEIVIYALKSAGFEVTGFETGAEFLAAVEMTPPNLVLLDIMLPGEDGLSILKKLRSTAQTKTLPIIMLTAKSSEIDKVKGLDMGADDYIVKPFGVVELISRVKALLRRAMPEPLVESQLVFGILVLNHDSRKVHVDGRKIDLTYKEYELLYYLTKNAEKALSRGKIMRTVWGYDFEGESRTLDMHIRSLRQKLGKAGEYIKTVRNVGYKLGDES